MRYLAKKIISSSFFLLAVLSLFFSSNVPTVVYAAGVSNNLKYQGQLTNSSGQQLSGTYTMSFGFYDNETAGNLVGSLITKTVTASNGYFSVEFTSTDLAGISFNQALWVEMSINGSSLLPRSSINSVPYANTTFGVVSGTIPPNANYPITNPTDGTLYFDTTTDDLYFYDGLAWTPVGKSTNNYLTSSLSDGKILIGNSAGSAVAATVSGDATLSNTGLLSLSSGSVNSNKILDNSIIDADISSTAQISLSKIASGNSIVTTLGTPTGSSWSGGSISSNTLTFSLADSTNPGLVSTTAQTFSGSKTINGTLTVASGNNIQIGNGDITFSPGIINQSRQIKQERQTTAGLTGNQLTIAAGSSSVGGTNLAGGNLILKSGNSTGTGISQIIFQAAKSGASGTTDNAPITLATLQSGGFILNPYGTNAGNTMTQRFAELAANGTNYVGFKAPDSITSNVTWTLPTADGTANQMLKTNGSGVLSWGALTFSMISDATTASSVTLGSVSPGSTLTLQSGTSGAVTVANLGTGSVQSTAGVLSVSSDERLKNITSNFTKGLESINGIIPINYTWNTLSGLPQNITLTGFSAQNIQSVIPEAVSQGENGYLGLQDRAIMATIVNAIKELSQKVSNAIAVFDQLFVREVVVQNLCVGTVESKTCITKQQLDALLQSNSMLQTDPNATSTTTESIINTVEQPVVEQSPQETVMTVTPPEEEPQKNVQ